MSEATVEPDTSIAPLVWTDPVCTEYAVEALTATFNGGAGDGNTGS
jgi:hypothetical protein